MTHTETNSKSRLPSMASQAGQGIVEYILVLVVTVAIILGGVYQLNDAFRVWATNYFGDYLSCLLETGELPTIGGGGGGGICNQLYEEFSLASGRPLVEGGGNGTGQDGENNNSSPGANENTNDSAQAGGARYVSARRGGGAGGGRFGSRFSPSNVGGAGGGGGRRDIGKENKLYTGSTEGSIPGSAMGSREGRMRSEAGDVDRGFYFANREDEQEERETKVPLKSVSERQSMERKKRMLINRKPATKEAAEADTELTFGSYLRYLIIAAIIIALVIFLGGQALQISKSME